MMHALSLALLMFVLSPVQIKAPQVPLNPYSIAEDYQRLYNLRILNDGGPARTREPDDCDRYEVQVWAALRIPLVPGDRIGGDRSFCVVELQPVEWNGDAFPDLLLIFGGRVFRQYRYALFLSEPDRFRYVGYVDGSSKYSDPVPKVIRFGQQSFLQTVVTADDTRVNKSDVIWSEFTPTGGRQVLTYPEVGAELGSDLIRDWTGFTQMIDVQSGVVAIELRALYSARPGSINETQTSLFTVADQVVYKWNPNTATFEVDPERSTLGIDEINQVFGARPPTDFLKVYLPELTRLAAEGSAEQKQWLRSWLDHEPASSQKQTLLELLSK